MPTPIQAIAGVANACQVLPTLVAGGQPQAGHIQALREAGVSVVLDIRHPMEPRPVDESRLVRSLGMEYFNIPVTHGALDDASLNRILEILRGSEDKTVFFHCASGNRVGGALIPYLMIDKGMHEEDAIAIARRSGLRSMDVLQWGLDYVRRHQDSPGSGSQ